MKVKVKITKWVFSVQSLEDVDRLLGALKELTHPLVFNADVKVIEEGAG